VGPGKFEGIVGLEVDKDAFVVDCSTQNAFVKGIKEGCSYFLIFTSFSEYCDSVEHPARIAF
jgi:hypothetical protein